MVNTGKTFVTHDIAEGRITEAELQNVGHGVYISVAQFQVRDAFERLSQLQKDRAKRGYSKPQPWPSN
jgi:hypothetical protein